MSKTALELSSKELGKYSPASRIKPAASGERTARAQSLARKAAQLLKERFHASRVVLFGSLAHGLWFTSWSDVDLAAWGIPPEQFYAAVAVVTGLDRNLTVSLVDAETASPEMQNAIEEEGIEM